MTEGKGRREAGCQGLVQYKPGLAELFDCDYEARGSKFHQLHGERTKQ